MSPPASTQPIKHAISTSLMTHASCYSNTSLRDIMTRMLSGSQILLHCLFLAFLNIGTCTGWGVSRDVCFYIRCTSACSLEQNGETPVFYVVDIVLKVVKVSSSEVLRDNAGILMLQDSQKSTKLWKGKSFPMYNSGMGWMRERCGLNTFVSCHYVV